MFIYFLLLGYSMSYLFADSTSIKALSTSDFIGLLLIKAVMWFDRLIIETLNIYTYDSKGNMI